MTGQTGAVASYRAPSFFTIEPGVPFLETLAAALCDGELVNGFRFDGDPMVLARARIYVPTRRAARELRSAFLDHLGGQSLLLPRVIPLGEFDSDEAFFAAGGDGIAATMPPAIDPMERQLYLGAAIARWAERLRPAERNLYGGEEIVTPVSTADAFWMARDLAELLDQLETEGIPFSAIEKAAERDVPSWWQLTRQFLEIIATVWPDYLAGTGQVDRARLRNLMLDAETERLSHMTAGDPIIVAGSTGTIPATARLIKTVAQMPGGAVVLPGYDRDMDNETRDALDSIGDVASIIGHPQYGMRKLARLAQAGQRDLVSVLRPSGPTSPLTARRHWVARAMVPSSVTAQWHLADNMPDPDGLADVAILHAQTPREEALAIATALRETIADGKSTCALVTPDRELARRVSAELQRFGINADDSGGTPFSNTMHGVLLELVMRIALTDTDAASFASLLRHPLCKIADTSERADAFELVVLRGQKQRFEVSALPNLTEAGIRANQDPETSRRRATSLPNVDIELANDLRAMTARFADALAPLIALKASGSPVPMARLAHATISAVEALALNEGVIDPALYDDSESGDALRGLFEQWLGQDLSPEMAATEWPAVVGALTASMAIKPDYGGHPRLSIWGTLEARLQAVDMMVLGSLNEGTWPAIPENDPFLTRAMKDAIGLEPPERRVGLAAHDFQMAMGTPRVLLTRAKRRDGSPTVASRWIQRLETLAGPDLSGEMHARGGVYARFAAQLTHSQTIAPAERPDPSPPVSARPKHFSVTDIEKLRRDPYAVYAKRVLGLQPLEPLIAEPDAALRGTIMHDCIEQFITAGVDFADVDALASMRVIARQVFDKATLPEDIDAVWWKRMEASLPNLLDWERSRLADVERAFAELRAGATPVADTAVTLSGRGDRFDLRTDGLVDIIDFKTGGHATKKQVQTGFAPQLPLEAALLKRGAFADLVAREPGDLVFVKFDGRGAATPTLVAKHNADPKEKFTSAEVAERDWEKLADLLKSYNDPSASYLSRAMPEKTAYAGDYDHLARVQEWALSNGDGDG
ncbi:MAG: double-strand break repair protein AddB [Pseudomonadota bacterium]